MLQAVHKKELTHILIMAAVVNAILNGFFAWLVTRETGFVPLWGIHSSIVFDFVLTGSLLGFLMAFLSTGARVKKAREEAYPALENARLSWMPVSSFQRALLMALVGVIFGLLLVALLALASVESMAMIPFMGLKIAFAVLLALFVDGFNSLRCWSAGVLQQSA